MYIIKYTHKHSYTGSPSGTFHVANTARYLELVEKLRSIGFNVKTIHSPTQHND